MLALHYNTTLHCTTLHYIHDITIPLMTSNHITLHLQDTSLDHTISYDTTYLHTYKSLTSSPQTLIVCLLCQTIPLDWFQICLTSWRKQPAAICRGVWTASDGRTHPLATGTPERWRRKCSWCLDLLSYFSSLQRLLHLSSHRFSGLVLPTLADSCTARWWEPSRTIKALNE